MDLQLRRLKEASLELKLFSFWQMIVLKKCKISFSFIILAKTVPAVLWSASQPYDLLVVGSFPATTILNCHTKVIGVGTRKDN